MSSAAATRPTPAMFGSEQIGALADASRRAKKIRRCVRVAAFGGWTTGVFGGISAMFLVLSFSISSLFISAALLIAAWGEFHGGAMVKRFDPRGARRLAWNQVFLGAALVVYAAWCLYSGLASGGAKSVASGNPDVDELVGGIERMATVVMYGGVAVVGVIGPGLTAWYYASREKIIREFRAATDPSVVQALSVA